MKANIYKLDKNGEVKFVEDVPVPVAVPYPDLCHPAICDAVKEGIERWLKVWHEYQFQYASLVSYSGLGGPLAHVAYLVKLHDELPTRQDFIVAVPQ